LSVWGWSLLGVVDDVEVVSDDIDAEVGEGEDGLDFVIVFDGVVVAGVEVVGSKEIEMPDPGVWRVMGV